MDLLKIRETLIKVRKTGQDLETYLNDSINIQVSRGVLLENTSDSIVYKLKELDYKKFSKSDYTKIALLFTHLEQIDLDDFRTFLKSEYSEAELEEKPTKPEEINNASIKEYNQELKEWNKRIDINKEWNRHFKFLIESLDDVITIDLYGDTSLNIFNMHYAYFKFYETNLKDMEVFIQEIKNSPSEVIKPIKTVCVDDISGSCPVELESAHEVKFYFETVEEVTEFRQSEDIIFSIYEKYIIRNDTMKKIGGEWGLADERKDNFSAAAPFSNPAVQPTHNVPASTAPSSSDWFTESCTVDLEECIYTEKMYEDGTTVFVIIPEEFFEEYGTILNNGKLHINGITDDSNWDRKYDGSYSYRKSYNDAIDYLDKNSIGDNSDLENLVKDIEDSKIEELTEDEVYDKYCFNNKGNDAFKPSDLEFELYEGGGELCIGIYPKGITDFDQHLPLARDIFGKYMLCEDSEASFSILVDDNPLRIVYSDIKDGYDFLISIGMTPSSEDLLEDFLKEVL